ncbi:MAG: peptidoglycan DD-metalloendopeptidase family protein [Candidatus Latescibacteria bacterium]|nr:peptidoglycan DD-metalloendopeptidase family protein [Candidatus Latescibacterota bacterium]NIM22650.1 peptidoglycan DD-metalloendopeptidase family protein [Candidatus Latescibacterota bacterium]NIO27964.1 peptidoglycan DD-metalloendopeptidase family protein [Candidatus Latescibacterota bacterium]NIO78854.1 peptidoglycan DD-metalloendopeptidase family protein [Candidatus Latescibacterota bacterium]NIT01477.1 peptidoglycan DD-metalloendopeptidase family protein [Candidatus Latescibacterota ba
MKKTLSIILVPHDDSRTRQYQLSYRLLYTFLVLTGIALLVISIFIVTYGSVLRHSKRAANLESQNQRLLRQSAQVDSLRGELVRLQAMSIQIKKMLGINLTPEDSILVASLSPIVKSPAIQEFQEEEGVGEEEQKAMLKAFPTLWPVKGYVTRGFHTTGGEKSADYHPGIDIAARRNTPIRASAEGIVVTDAWDDTYGYMVVIDHGFGIYTLYGHNARNLVKNGDRVARGQIIAFVGNTGKSTAPHLHFEIRENGVPKDPNNYLLD